MAAQILYRTAASSGLSCASPASAAEISARWADSGLLRCSESSRSCEPAVARRRRALRLRRCRRLFRLRALDIENWLRERRYRPAGYRYVSRPAALERHPRRAGQRPVAQSRRHHCHQHRRQSPSPPSTPGAVDRRRLVRLHGRVALSSVADRGARLVCLSLSERDPAHPGGPHRLVARFPDYSRDFRRGHR